MKDYRAIIDVASEPLVRLFREEAERMVKHHLCQGRSCPEFCRKAKRDIAIVMKLYWQGYARWN